LKLQTSSFEISSRDWDCNHWWWPKELKSVTCHMRSSAMSPDWHRWKHHTNGTATPAREAGTLFTYPWRREGWVDLTVVSVAVVRLHPALQLNELMVATVGKRQHANQ